MTERSLRCLLAKATWWIKCNYQRWSRGHKARGQRHKKKIGGQGQEQPFPVQTLSRPRTGMLEAKDTDASVLRKKKVFKNIFWAISRRGIQENSSQIFCEVLGVFQQNFKGSKNSAVLEPRTGQFLRTWGQGLDQGLDLRDQGLQNVSSRARTSSRTPPLVITIIVITDLSSCYEGYETAKCQMV